MMRVSRFVSVFLLVGASSVPCIATSVAAQPANRVTPAEDFFQRAKVLMAAKDYAKACPLLAESYRLDPAGGTLQNLAVCYEASGLWASAYGRFQELRSLSERSNPPRTERIALAEERVAAIEPRLSRVILVPASTPPDSPLSVKIDDVDYRSASWSAGIVLDPGEHTLVVSAPRKKTFRRTLSVAKEGTQERVEIPRLEDEPIATVRPPLVAELYRPDAGLRIPGIVVGGIGGAALAVGAVFGVLTVTTNDSAKDRCSGDANLVGPGGRPEFGADGHCLEASDAVRASNAKRDEARTFANVANVLVPVGVVALGTGVYLLIRSGREAERPAATRAARFVPTLGGALVEGTF